MYDRDHDFPHNINLYTETTKRSEYMKFHKKPRVKKRET